MHFVCINTFLWAALRRKIACHKEEIVVKAVFLPRGWRLAGTLLLACFISKRCRESKEDGWWLGGGGCSFWSRLVPADLSCEVEKGTFYQSFTSDSPRRLAIFTEDPVAWAGKNGHISVQVAAELTDQTGKGEGAQSINAGGGDVFIGRCD